MSSGGSWASWLFAKCIERLNKGPPNTNPSSEREENLNLGSQDYKLSALTLGHAVFKKAMIETYFWKKTNLPFLIKQELNLKLIHL